MWRFLPRFRPFLYFLLAACAGTETCVAQPPASPQTTIRTTVPLVVVPVSVSDAQGRPIDGLSADDFVVLDDGKPRAVRVDASDAIIAPFSVVIAIQTSDISQPALLKIRQVGSIIAESVAGFNGEVAVVAYNDEVKVLRTFTKDPNAVTDTFEDLKPGGDSGGRMLDGVAKALDLLEHRPAERRPLSRRTAIFVIGEAKDRGSQAKLADVVNRSQKLAATIYGVSYSAYLTAFTTKGRDYQAPLNGKGLLGMILEASRLAKENAMQTLVAATGGQHVSFETKRKLENNLMALSKEIHSRYYLSFTPVETETPAFHELTIRIRERPQAQVHARPGYWTGLENAPPK